MNRTTLDVAGMHCASCVARVEKSLAAVPGVAQASVNLLAKRAEVWHPDAVEESALLAAVRAAGFEAAVHAADAAGPSRTAGHGGPATEGALGARFGFTFAVAWVSMFLSMPLMHADGMSAAPGLVLAVMKPLDALTRTVFPFLYAWPAGLLRWLLLAVTAPVLLWSARDFFVRTGAGLRHGRFDMDSLVSIGTGTAFAYSAFVTLAPDAMRAAGASTDVYFEAVPWVLSLVTLGRMLEERSKRRAGEAVRALADRLPGTVRLRRDGRDVDVPLEEVGVGDVIVLRPGERLAVDGVVESGHTAVDESLITGEPVPVEHGPGDEVTGGTINGTGSITYRATRVGADTRVARIVRLLEEAMAGKPSIQRTVDRVAAVFVPVVLGIAGITLAVWLVSGPGVALAVQSFVSVLIIACPCAMGLAVPAAIAVATGRAAALGMLVRDGAILETAHRVDTVVLDKTGTITVGRPEVVAFEAPGDGADEVLAAAAALEARSEHPLAGAVLRFARSRGVEAAEASSVFTQPGGGVFGKVGERKVRVGTAAFLREKGADPSPLEDVAARWEGEGVTPVLVAVDGAARGAFGIRDPLQDGAAEAVAALRKLGLRTVMLSGDRKRVAEAVGAEAGVDEVIGEASPEAKVDAVRALRRSGRVVLMAGDGVNDAPALAEADLGVAMGGGADVAREAADITLVSGRLASLPGAVRLSRAAIGIIRQNLAWAFGYNVIAIPLAAGLFFPWTGWLLSPVIASAAMALSSVSVVSNSLRLRRFRG